MGKSMVLRHGEEFLSMVPKSRAMERKGKLNYVKIKNLCSLRVFIKRMKRKKYLSV